jgi:hypothetical protein
MMKPPGPPTPSREIRAEFGERRPPGPATPSREIRAEFGEDSDLPNYTMPQELRDTLCELEEWALINKRDAKRDAIAFWILKIPAILASASAGVWAHFNFITIGVIAGAIASVCVIIDGVHPRGMLRNIHLRAFHDIRNLSTKMVSGWRARNKSFNDAKVAAKLIRDAESERTRIALYIRNTETALKFDHKD